jgi:hypothetical protein
VPGTSFPEAPIDGKIYGRKDAAWALAAAGGASITVGATPPTLAVGVMWWDSVGGQLYVGYDDGNSLQFVPATNAPAGSGGGGGGASVTISPTPPTVVDKALWWDSTGGQLYIGYDDGNSLAWVVTNSTIGVGSFLPLVGGALTGALTGTSATFSGLMGTMGYSCRGGTTGGFGANAFNISWSSPNASLWIDSVNRGTIALGGPFLPMTGGTLTGLLTVPNLNIASGGSIGLSAPSGTNRVIYSYTGVLARWGFHLGDTTAETGSTTGSHFMLTRFDDAGTYIGPVLSISRTTGVATFANTATFSAGLQSSGSAIFITSAPGAANTFQGRINNVVRWNVYLGAGEAETGGNAGSNFYIQRTTDAGAYLGNSIGIQRVNGVATFEQPIVNGSDRRTKRDIAPITGALAAIQKLQGVNYKPLLDEKRHVGLIAQDVLDAIPEIVFETPAQKDQAKQLGVDEGEPILGIAYGNLVAVLVEAVKELSARLAVVEGAR